MKHIIFKCSACNLYTLSSVCKKCSNPTVNPHPMKYSPEDRFGKYRRIAKKRLENG